MIEGQIEIHVTDKGTKKAVIFDVMQRKFSLEEAIDKKGNGPSIWFGNEYGDRGRFDPGRALKIGEILIEFGKTGKIPEGTEVIS
ncbi:hypothetical protein [Leptospira stimsonii]|uniref:Uncharacterized protein n=1 Tax=Leptospira stimsonii TaxID=2202203 RepID=A0ABY2MY26_9LEPT|nr:hypothetical protein [Leptospira stimsonii]TGK12837.1 hypothetical protein EHO98_19555 [Leptospira stimsonii]TGM11091.1 hypothetical protein EHQ90_16870 [Leptospira stimsonii]